MASSVLFLTSRTGRLDAGRLLLEENQKGAFSEDGH